MNSSNSSHLFRGQVFLAPLTKGGNLPFRRLCLELGATVTMGEMALAHKLLKGSASERALLRRAEQESRFGAQLAGRDPDPLAEAARLAQEMGADFVDLNLGCPIDLLCRRGLGAALMRKPARVERIVKAMVAAVDIPVTVKIRLGWDDQKPRYRQIGLAAQEAGAACVFFHGRSRKQRYRRAADWEAIAALAEELTIPVVGNGDLLTWRDVDRRWKGSGCAGVMLGRGALMKPWIFREIELGEDLLLTPRQRLDILRRYVALALEHFGEDERGRKRVREFLAFHLDFFNRYRPVASEAYGENEHPLIQTRDETKPVAEGILKLMYENGEEEIASLVHHLMDECEPLNDRSAASILEES